ncbi:MAG: rhodanese-like domain-containing protein [Actinomycetota bacterium]|nr:rhodanese-like domain-containing protein [Actinomycetota bacterium]
MSNVTETPAASPEAARAHFATRLALETDCADVAADLKAGTTPYTVLDVRSPKAYAFGHVPGALNVPSPTIDAGVAASLPDGLLVVYCWGPGCNGAHKAAARLAEHGRQVKEMIGGFEYWAREGQPIEGRRAERLAAEATPALVG